MRGNMIQTVEAIYEDGVLKLVQPLRGLAERARVKVTIDEKEESAGHIADCAGIMPDEDAEEMLQIIEDEFEKVDPGD